MQRVKDIYAEAWELFKANWKKLLSMSFIGYFLPLMLIAWLSYEGLTSNVLYDCAPCAILMLGLSLLMIMAFVFWSKFSRPRHQPKTQHRIGSGVDGVRISKLT